MTKADFENLKKNAANFVPLTPISFLKRTSALFPDRVAVVHGERFYTWSEVASRCKKLATALNKSGVKEGDTVSVIAFNTPEMIEAHYGINMAGAVLNAINVRLDPETIAYILDHGEARVLITDTQFAPSVKKALEICQQKPLIIDITDSEAEEQGERLGSVTYEDFLDQGEDNIPFKLPEDEWQAMALNYTSGTSGRPKGVVYHHRGAYLMSIGTSTAWEMSNHPNYLYVVPLFHCNGWNHVWTMTLMAATIHCTRQLSAKIIYDAIADHKITHFGGAPIILGLLVNAKEEERRDFSHTVQVFTAGAPPPPAILESATRLGLNITHVYGLTETYGHVSTCQAREEWNGLDFADLAGVKARQGVTFPTNDEIRIVDLETGKDVPEDGESPGEILIRGNMVMKGYFRQPEATEKAFEGGWFHTGDVAVMHPQGYIQIKDRLKDVIITGGENVSSVEVEAVLYKHPAVAAAAVVAKPDEKWGEVPCAFVELKPGQFSDEKEIIAFARQQLAGFKTPKAVLFEELPKTATGKIQKFALRKKAQTL